MEQGSWARVVLASFSAAGQGRSPSPSEQAPPSTHSISWLYSANCADGMDNQVGQPRLGVGCWPESRFAFSRAPS